MKTLLFLLLSSTALALSGHVMAPHRTEPGMKTATLKVVNSRPDIPLRWSYSSRGQPWSPWFSSGAAVSRLLPGTFTVRFQSSSIPPPNELAVLSPGERETLTVRWK